MMLIDVLREAVGMRFITCPCCRGERGFIDDYDEWGRPLIQYDCGFCGGRGRVSLFGLVYWWWLT